MLIPKLKLGMYSSKPLRCQLLKPVNQAFAVTAGISLYLWRVHQHGYRLHLDAELVASSGKLIPMSEVEKHNSRDSLWVVINGKIYDLTKVNPHSLLTLF